MLVVLGEYQSVTEQGKESENGRQPLKECVTEQATTMGNSGV